MHGYVIATAVALIVPLGPALLSFAGMARANKRAAAPTTHLPWPWKLTLQSALLYTLAFNLTFFIQELFLVLPKAFTPGLRATLFHNNHQWQGEHPLAALFQGTGAVATLATALVCAGLLHRGTFQSRNTRLFLIWMTYCGFLMALPQVAIGALSTGSDLGMAMGDLQLSAEIKLLAALLALGLIPLVALWLTRPLLALADVPERIASTRARTRFIFAVATLPAWAGIALIIPYRIPREWIEVALMPVWVTLLGVGWIQAGAWRCRAAPATSPHEGTIAAPLAAAVVLLLLFQCVLRPGIAFF